MESVTRAFYARADLDLILASPVAARSVFAVRIATVALAVARWRCRSRRPSSTCWSLRGGWRWLGAYGVIVAMGAAAAAFAVVLTVALFRAIGPKRTRLVAQVVAAIIGAAFVIGCRSPRSSPTARLSRGDVLQSPAVLALAPDSTAFCGGRRAPCLATSRRSRRCCRRRRPACRRHRDLRPALRRLRDGRGRRCRPRGAPARTAAPSANLAAARAAPQGMAAAAARPLARCRRR